MEVEKYIMMGSSRFKIKKNMKDSLAGRAFFLELLPFSVTHKKVIALVISLVLFVSLVSPSPVCAAENNKCPAWVKQWERWVAAEEMTREDYGLCHKGHEAPKGFRYLGYTTGTAMSDTKIAGLLIFLVGGIFALLEVSSIAVACELIGGIFGYIPDEVPVTYYKYIYTNGSVCFVHTVYTVSNRAHRVEYQIGCDTRFTTGLP